MAHAPYPATASHIPTTAPANSPTALDTATILTSIFFIRRLVCTMAVAFRMNPRNMTRLMGMMRRSPWKQSAISGALKNRMAYMDVATPRLNHNTVE